ncbi:MAG: metallophosphoesterase family protein [Sphingobium sp.]
MKTWGLFGRARILSSEGARLYAIGDVHGCYDALVSLFARIQEDNAQRSKVETHIVMLGDYIDRGPQSAQVCELLYSLRASGHFHCLMGNHEQSMIESVEGNLESLRLWLQYGGVETLASWNVPAHLIAPVQSGERDGHALVADMADKIPREIMDWMTALPTHWSLGDYMFVHAGVRPKVPLDEQDDQDLLWIREAFLKSKANHGKMIVHGHSVTDEPEIKTNRIGIDTGAYRTGILTAVGIEDDAQWIVQSG